MPDTDPADIDATMTAIFDHGFYIAGVYRRQSVPGSESWTIRIASMFDADHDTFHNGWGRTFTAAAHDACEFAARVADTVSRTGQ